MDYIAADCTEGECSCAMICWDGCSEMSSEISCCGKKTMMRGCGSSKDSMKTH
jgi:hypothetical protein